MAATDATPLLRVAAEAALAVPGVAGLQPRLAHRLAAAASPTRPETTAERIPSEASVRVVRIDRAPDGPGWRVEVRCVLAEGPRALDTARNVHHQVRAAVISHLAAHSAPEAVTVTVTVTRVVPGPCRPSPTHPQRFGRR